MAADNEAKQMLATVLLAAVARRLDVRVLWHLCGWGLTAAAALSAVVLVSQTPAGGERLQSAFAREPEPQAVAAVPPRAVIDAEETRRLAEAVRRLTADRDRLQERVASLERNFDDMTGSIKTVMQANAAAQSATEPAKEKAAPPVNPPVIVNAPAVIPAPTPSSPPAQATQPQESVPLPPVRVASAPPAEVPGEAQPAKIEYGIDLGGRVSLDALRQHWVAVKAIHGPLLTGLRAVAAQRLRQSGTDYRLILGPLASADAAAKLCIKLNAVHAACRTAKFFGEELAQP